MKKEERSGQSKVVGVIITIAFHALLLLVMIFMAFKVKAPEPASLLIEVELEDELVVERIPNKPKQEFFSEQAAAPRRTTDPKVKPTGSERKSTPSQQTKASAPGSVDEVGDLPVKEEPKPINPKSLYSSRDVGTQQADNTGKVDERALYRGGVEGTSDYTAGSSSVNGPSFNLTGRSTVGSLPEPSYPIQEAGKVVVEITVDQQGTVIKAVPGARGTTVQDSKLWDAARVAALKARFNKDEKAASIQTGTITYIFKLK